MIHIWFATLLFAYHQYMFEAAEADYYSVIIDPRRNKLHGEQMIAFARRILAEGRMMRALVKLDELLESTLN